MCKVKISYDGLTAVHSHGSLFTQWNVELLIRRTVKWQLAHPAECGVTDELAIHVTFLQHRNANNSS